MLKGTEMPPVETIFKSLLDEYKYDRLMRYEKISSLLNTLYIDLSRSYHPRHNHSRANESQIARIRQLEVLVDEHYTDIKSPHQYATMMFMSQKHLNRICKTYLNKTISEVISEKIVLEAKRMLIHTEKSVLQISQDLGYIDNSYFTRLFKKKVGSTPLEFQHSKGSKR